MILEERHLPFKEIGNLFKIVAEELNANVNTQILINEDILKELSANNSNYNVYFHNYYDNYFVNQWYTLHKSHEFSPELSTLGTQSFGANYSHVTRFSFHGYNFSDRYKSGEFIFYEHKIQRILVIEVS